MTSARSITNGIVRSWRAPHRWRTIVIVAKSDRPKSKHFIRAHLFNLPAVQYPSQSAYRLPGGTSFDFEARANIASHGGATGRSYLPYRHFLDNFPRQRIVGARSGGNGKRYAED